MFGQVAVTRFDTRAIFREKLFNALKELRCPLDSVQEGEVREKVGHGLSGEILLQAIMERNPFFFI